MRDISPTELDLLHGAEYGIHLRVFMADSEGVMQPLHALAGVDWVESVQWTEGIDQPVMSGTLTLRREVDHEGVRLSLSPLMESSPLNRDSNNDFAPQIAPFRRLTVFTATVPLGTDPEVGDWRQVVEGVVDDPSFGGRGSRITIEFRDRGAELLDAMIEEERIYSDDDGTLVEDVMQQIIDDNGHSHIELHVPVSPGWMIRGYRQETGSILTADRALALQIGWEVRFRWVQTTGSEEYRLTFYEPLRDTPTADTEFTQYTYLDVPSLKLAGAEIRNVARVWYVDAETGQTTFEEYTHLGSVALNGRRFMQISEDDSSNISSATEALAMATAAVEDLHSPLADQIIETLYFWPAQLGDVYDFAPNGTHYDEVQRWGVVGLTHTLANGSGRTQIVTRGQPAGAYRTWLNMAGQGRRTTPGYFPAPEIGPVWGESAMVGQGGDGAIWLRLKFDEGTRNIRVYSKTGPALPLPMPGDGNGVTNIDVERKEGATAGAADWETYVPMATTPGWWRKLRVVPYGNDGLPGIPVVMEAQAVNAIEPDALPAVTGFSVTRLADTATLDWTAGVHDSPSDVLYMVWRNGGVITALPAPESPPAAMQFVDEGIEPGQPYDYAVFAWSDGVTSVAATVPDPGNPPPPPPPVPSEPEDDPNAEHSPQWSDPPSFGVDGSITLSWTCTHPDAYRIRFEHRASVASAWLPDGDSLSMVPSQSAASGSGVVIGYTSPLWRLIAVDVSDNVLGVSDVGIIGVPGGGLL